MLPLASTGINVGETFQSLKAVKLGTGKSTFLLLQIITQKCVMTSEKILDAFKSDKKLLFTLYLGALNPVQ